MSLFGAMTTAISGLNAQSRSLGHISDNLANSQTVGFKRVDTNFVDLVTQSNATLHAPGSVMARPDYTNTIQGTIEQSENALALAIGGQGFFSVAMARSAQDGSVAFDERQFYTRAGDFRMDSEGYLVNGSNYYLQGWPVDTSGVVDRTTVGPIRVSQSVFNPIATSSIDIAANLPALDPPAVPADAKSFSTQVQVYDQLGTLHPLTLTFSQTPAGTPRSWQMSISPSPAGGAVDIPIVFGTDGTIQSLNGTAGTPNSPVTFNFDMDFGLGNQPISLNMGAFGQARGITQHAGTDFSLRNLEQNGVPPGAYSGLAIRENGDIAVNYDNGQSRVIARVPIVSFSDPDKLQRLDGQAFMRTIESGEARISDASTNGVGKLVVGATEASNVDIGSEFTKLIVAQRAYTANTRVVTTADEMLQDTINMKR
ncbi:flagellar hook protein FlgE [Roseococcus sp. YIM B11640]|uniref:flagellar hook protein FlgE n=1 Tax=Roseococcus sp. YIM B11640 TaxID=3133973 RepID=UPI003C79E4D5